MTPPFWRLAVLSRTTTHQCGLCVKQEDPFRNTEKFVGREAFWMLLRTLNYQQKSLCILGILCALGTLGTLGILGILGAGEDEEE